MKKQRWLTEAPFDKERLRRRAEDLGMVCRWCGTDVSRGRAFCGSDCRREWYIRTGASSVRLYVEQRDRGVCAQCGVDTQKQERVLWHVARLFFLAHPDWRPIRFGDHYDPWSRDLRERWGWPMDRYARRSYWDADHVVPVSEGGGACGLDNYRTLCLPCHKGETRDLAARRARRRKMIGTKQQRLFG